MKSRLHKIEITNFKAFREFTLDLQDRNLLVYGGNGSGKSSLYWALYTFLQSAGKQPRGSISKYFEAGGKESLLNTHEQEQASPRPGEIALTLRDTVTKTDTTFRISKDNHGTHNEPAILKGDLASDFITYRFFFGFSNFKNSERFDLWPLFETEILPFCVKPGAAQTPFQQWQNIRGGIANPWGSRGLGGADAYARFKNATDQFAATLGTVVNDISRRAQEFYDEYFAKDDVTPVLLVLGVTRPPSFSGTNQQNSRFHKPIIELHLRIGQTVIKRPQSFLNEAKMTQVALSVRLAASLVNLQEDEQNYLKLLVLDDLLVSLDMSNRMKVVAILLSPTFANYQKIILTHDFGFFQECKREIGSCQHEWLFQKLVGNAKDGPSISNVKSALESAQQFLSNDQIAECGNQLRKCVEANLTSFLEQAKEKKGLDPLIDREEFASLHQKLNEATGMLSLDSFHQFAELLQDKFSLEQLGELTSPDEIDIKKFNALSREKKGAVIAKMYAARSDLQQSIITLLSDASRKRLNALKLLDEVRRIKDRILNPASHAGATPLYTKEAEDAIKVIQALAPALDTALTTLDP